MLVAEVGGLRAGLALPDGVTVRPVVTEADLGLFIQVHEQVFGQDHSRLRQVLLAVLHEDPESMAMVLAMAGDEPVCSARVEFPAGTEFAGLWGGGTMPAWRGRGIYRALVAYRAGLAARPGLPLPDRGRLRRQRADPAPPGFPLPGPDHALAVGPGGARMTPLCQPRRDLLGSLWECGGGACRAGS